MMLVFQCNTNEDFDKFKIALDKSRFYADGLSYQEKTLYFDPKNEEKELKLREGLQKIINQQNINGKFKSEK